MKWMIADAMVLPYWATIGSGAIVVIPILTFVTGLLLVWRDSIVAARKAGRGFEVKLTTGQTPVLPKKEVDHG